MKKIPQILLILFLLYSCQMSNEMWTVKKVELGNDYNVYLKSWVAGLRGEHSRTIISENNEKIYNEIKDIDLGQFVTIRYRIEDGKFILLQTNNATFRNQTITEMENIIIKYVSVDEYLHSEKNIIENFRDDN